MSDIRREMAIRLAWYIDRHGGIPETEQAKLMAIAMGLRNDEEAKRIQALVEDIREYFEALE